MSDFVKTGFGGNVGRFSQDMERSLTNVRKDLDSVLDYSPAQPDDDWVSPPPDSIVNAIDRIAFHIRSNGNGGGINTKIVKLPGA